MLVTISEYTSVAVDAQGHVLPLGNNRTACQSLTDSGIARPLGSGTKIIRVATDTPIQMDVTGGTTGSQSEFIPGDSKEYFSCNGGEVFTILKVKPGGSPVADVDRVETLPVRPEVSPVKKPGH